MSERSTYELRPAPLGAMQPKTAVRILLLMSRTT